MGGSGSQIQPESKAIGGIDSLDPKQMKDILFQMENCICKIYNERENKVGTGFFCKIPFPNKSKNLYVLITCNHVLDKNNLTQGTEIKFTLNDDTITKKIVINNSRRIYTRTLKENEKDITMIEIDPEKDNINLDAFLNFDENIYKDNLYDIYKNKSVYVIHYEDGKTKKYSPGLINSISDNKITINHNCTTKEGSSGGPIINLKDYGVIGIHKGFLNNINKGTLLKIPIDEFKELRKNEDPKLPDVKKPTLGKTNDSFSTNQTNPLSLYSQGNQPIKKINSSYQTKIEVGNFYVSNIELFKIN